MLHLLLKLVMEKIADFIFFSCHVRHLTMAMNSLALPKLRSLQRGNSFLPSAVHSHDRKMLVQLLKEKKNKILVRVTSWK